MKKVMSIAVVAVAQGCANLALADDANEQVMAPVTITSTQTEKVVTDAPASVSVVTQQQIETQNVTRFDEALVGTVGVYMNGQNEGMPNNYNNMITLRGMPYYNRTAVLVDGVSINDGFSQGVDASLIPIDSIKQVEVAPGPFSSLYGGSAMGGVVNIITVEPTKREFIVDGGYGSDETYKTSGTYRDKFDFTQGSLGVVAYLQRDASGGYVQSLVGPDYTLFPPFAGTATGWRSTTYTDGSPSQILGDQGNVGWWTNNAGLKLIYNSDSVGKFTSDFSYHNYATTSSTPNLYLTSNGVPVPTAPGGGTYLLAGSGGTYVGTTPADYLNGPNGQEVFRYNLTYETKVWSDASLKAHAGFMQDNYWFIEPGIGIATPSGGAGSYVYIPSNKTDLDVQLGKPIGTQHYLVVGLAGELSTLDETTNVIADWRNPSTITAKTGYDNAQSHTESAYIQDEYTIINPLTLYVGGRYDYWTTSGTMVQNPYMVGPLAYTYAYDYNFSDRSSEAFSPKAALVYKVDDSTTLRTSWGKSFRAPNLSDMYSGYGFIFFGSESYSYANPALDPEKARSWEAGGEHTFPIGTTIKGSVYLTQMSNYIDYYMNPTNYNYYTVNAGKVHIKGFEAEIRQHLISKIYAFANMTRQSSIITSDTANPSAEGFMVAAVPQVMYNLGVQGDYKPFFGSLIIQHVGKTYGSEGQTDSAINVMGSYDPYTIGNAKIGWHITDNYTVTASVNNITDQKYFQYTAAPGRTFFLGASVHY